MERSFHELEEIGDALETLLLWKIIKNDHQKLEENSVKWCFSLLGPDTRLLRGAGGTGVVTSQLA
jgi:hypothetical protein